MKKVEKLFLAGAAFFAMLAMGCSVDSDSGDGSGTRAAAPEIKSQPAGATYTQGTTDVNPLTITATTSDDGQLSYQWYKASYSGSIESLSFAAIDGATTRYCTPSTATAGTFYYTCSVTNTLGSSSKTVESDLAKIVIQSSGGSSVTNAAQPVISSDLSTDAGWCFVGAGDVTPYTITATVSDGGTLSYQWYSKEDKESSYTAVGANSDSYLPSVSAAGKFSFYCVVTNTNTSCTGNKTATVTSKTAVLNVQALTNAETPSITANPSDATYTVNAAAAALSVTASVTDGGTLSYQWYNGNGAISGATDSAYTPSTSAEGSVSYYCVVTNTKSDASGNKTATAESTKATITVVKADETVYAAAIPVIADLSSVTYNAGASASAITASATQSSSTSGNIVYETGTLSYSWTLNGSDVSSTASFTPDTATAGTYTYTVTVTNTTSRGNTAKASKTVIVTVKALTNAETPSITKAPVSASYDEGATAASLTVTASVTDGGTLSYQWYVNDTAISGATGTSYTPSCEAAGTYVYYVIVTNTNSSCTGNKTASTVKAQAAATITVNEIEQPVTPVITSDLSSEASLDEDGNCTLSVTASASNGTLTYQLYKDGAKSGSAQASGTFTVTAAGTYYVQVINTLNGMTSTYNSTSCTVSEYSDGTGSGTIGFQF